MNYSDIQKANSEIKTIDLKGKNYAMVAERVTAFRKVFPDGFINTSIVSHDGTTVLMQCVVGYYEERNQVVLATGFAQEVKGRGLVNGTSYIENCETSAVGRALGMMGFGINDGNISSAEEIANALDAQAQIKEQEKHINDGFVPNEQIDKSKTLPMDEVANFIRNEICDIQERLKLKMYIDARKKVFELADTLVKSGAVPEFDWLTITMDEAKNVFKAIREILFPEGDEK